MGNSAEARSVPGKPNPVTTESGAAPGLLPYEGLYTLSYLRNNALKTRILSFTHNENIEEIVSKAKLYCKQNNLNFSWIEQTIISIE